MIVIVDYGAGNLTSVQRAVSYLGYESLITNEPEKIVNAERIIFPGVGAAGSAMEEMKARGIDDALEKAFKSGIPMLGICVGCQIIMDGSEENDAVCLGLIKGTARAFPSGMKEENGILLKVPHMGWNGLNVVQPHPLFNGVGKEDEFYFVHSYFPEPLDRNNVFGVTEYGVEFVSAVGLKNLFATQFHLEKSGKPGLLILKNFCIWEP
ncbi:Imidazole glycerol phosphate synthase subunit HisH [Desulfamplus magnetovallimortis]|uniref:Imidazole glycerol phosphate synthase subunit HisH n=1 Tax=Desulfamplus magnetovallimortis TaxID=1246637 RepID=A0A1W1H969_9BACT|nr:imidazole glycerol phosphate synthase subunit HisH [Desulfamplus magnetovallimortis]SLM29021.1 Imidazole glycerol phosphate synthase subunit HisH [Desulfamplus magnetovallimortis]